MTISIERIEQAAFRLHQFLVRHHWDGEVIIGPDSGIRWNFKLGRFIKSYLSFIPWQDCFIFMQAQGYWVLCNWLLADLTGEERYRRLAMAGSSAVVARQKPEGYWDYPPLPSRKGKIATVEGNLATIGLLESYNRSLYKPFLTTAQKWNDFLIQEIGFQEQDRYLAINYFAYNSESIVPNNTTLTLWTLAKFAQATQDDRYLSLCRRMVGLLCAVQQESGEFPYVVNNAKTQAKGRLHFLCYQYNAFEFLDLAEYFRLTGDPVVKPLLEKLVAFLSNGITRTGAARNDCMREKPTVLYYTAAVAAALSRATEMGLGDYQHIAERAYSWVLKQQTIEGGAAFFSHSNYGILRDRRSYPRNLVMILYHLLLELAIRNPTLTGTPMVAAEDQA